MLNSSSHCRGFTLIEVMVALAILSMLSLLVAQTMKSSMDNRTRAAAEIARESRVADAIRIIKADVASAFHYRDLNSYANPTPTPPVPGVPAVAPPNPANPTPKIKTEFVGEKEAMYFTTLSNVRVLQDSPESDQAKVGYFLKSCSSGEARGKRTQSKCLFRSSTPILDEDVTKPGPEVVLLENVEEFKLRYLGPGKEELQDAWRSDMSAILVFGLASPNGARTIFARANGEKRDRKYFRSGNRSSPPLAQKLLQFT